MVRLSPVLFYVMLFFVALTPSVVFGLWIYSETWEPTVKIAAWDPFIKVMAIAGAVIVGLASFERFLDQRRQELANQELARVEERKGVFNQAIRATSTIITGTSLSGTEEANAVTAFWRLYWGDLAQYEGPQVEAAMVEFGRALQLWQQIGQKPELIKELSLNVAHACRTELEEYQKRIDTLRGRFL